MTHDLAGITWNLDYALALNTDMKETGVWELSLNKVPGAFGMIADGPSSSKKTLTGNQKCLNCDGPHHLSLCPKEQNAVREKKNCKAHNATRRLSCPPMDLKWRPPEPSKITNVISMLLPIPEIQ